MSMPVLGTSPYNSRNPFDILSFSCIFNISMYMFRTNVNVENLEMYLTILK